MSPKISKTGCTPKQRAYAMRTWGGQGDNKTQIAREVGYSGYVAMSASSKIEATKGFQNAMSKLAHDSNNMALAVMSELKSRGFSDFSNKDLIGALNAISGAWSKFTEGERNVAKPSENTNKLRTVILQSVENQVISPQMTPPDKPVDLNKVEDLDKVDLDF